MAENKTLNFKLDEGEEYIELISLLKYMNVAATGGQAKMMVENNIWFVFIYWIYSVTDKTEGYHWIR